MEELIKALQILLKYGNHEYPTHCEHDTLFIVGIKAEDISNEDKIEVEKLGFEVGNEDGLDQIYSLKYGSA